MIGTGMHTTLAQRLVNPLFDRCLIKHVLTVWPITSTSACLVTMMIQVVDRPNTTPIGQDKKTVTFKALLLRVRFSKISLFCMKVGEGLYRSL